MSSIHRRVIHEPQSRQRTAESCNELLNFRSTVTKIVAVLANIEVTKLVHR